MSEVHSLLYCGSLFRGVVLYSPSVASPHIPSTFRFFFRLPSRYWYFSEIALVVDCGRIRVRSELRDWGVVFEALEDVLLGLFTLSERHPFGIQTRTVLLFSNLLSPVQQHPFGM